MTPCVMAGLGPARPRLSSPPENAHMTFIPKPKLHHPELPKNALGYHAARL